MTDKLNHATNYREFEGSSTETKPTDDIGENSKFYELDTGDVYYFDGESTWAKVGGN